MLLVIPSQCGLDLPFPRSRDFLDSQAVRACRTSPIERRGERSRWPTSTRWLLPSPCSAGGVSALGPAHWFWLLKHDGRGGRVWVPWSSSRYCKRSCIGRVVWGSSPGAYNRHLPLFSACSGPYFGGARRPPCELAIFIGPPLGVFTDLGGRSSESRARCIGSKDSGEHGRPSPCCALCRAGGAAFGSRMGPGVVMCRIGIELADSFRGRSRLLLGCLGRLGIPVVLVL
ncbi:hypothetical protein FB45DRAFT_1094147 [Roridomyces roridus]|uniref:Uncharacterized protein n=1 Tax=Roridomyces roridus TaxID=1738132 RepID=A0AAD7BGJ6_9AGAR|nr:hypothetical protein FB45DRAFT_1094147 [Roridomyces roridus]